jgi:hypothetical protein
VDALDLHPLNVVAVDRPLGMDADAWFMALDGRVVRMGSSVVIARVAGIHPSDDTLWIQLSLTEDDDTPGVVVQVHGRHTLQHALDALAGYELRGEPLEIIKVDCGTAPGDTPAI